MVCGNWGDFNTFSTLWLHVPLNDRIIMQYVEMFYCGHIHEL